jgi:hypothetical protein
MPSPRVLSLVPCVRLLKRSLPCVAAESFALILTSSFVAQTVFIAGLTIAHTVMHASCSAPVACDFLQVTHGLVQILQPLLKFFGVLKARPGHLPAVTAAHSFHRSTSFISIFTRKRKTKCALGVLCELALTDAPTDRVNLPLVFRFGLGCSTLTWAPLSGLEGRFSLFLCVHCVSQICLRTF